ncbi:MAG: hypothetical protein AUK47_02740 [Deltaproteobacteria bacterium CG2_30_63_29]|nr:MAG: hypothetical protein AUK47_02740 [Deltaproteobacteria bacterium CG2_30_63_29]PJB37928.1 MAG: HAD-IB family hydrolase [Deltaproteobacteria bacterium CG_4_9_14_3_um_filter_63_12]
MNPEGATQGAGDSPVVAFFDMDQTILRCNSASRYAKFLYRRGELSLRDVLRTARWLVEYRFAVIDAQAVTRRVISSVEGQPAQHLTDLCQEWFDTDIIQFISEDAVAVIEDHRRSGHQVVLLTAATEYIARPVSHHLKLDGAVSTYLESDSKQRLTGRVVEPICFGEGKIHWARQWADQCGATLENAFFYTDSFTDLPMLEAVGHPRIVNPDPRLRRYAKKRGLETLCW